MAAAMPAAACATLAVGACASAAGVIFDIPDRQPSPVAAPTLAAASAQSRDTSRPRIESLTDRDSILALLPRDPTGTIDWDRARRDGVIRPREGPQGDPRTYLEGFGYDLVLQSGLGSFPALFPHSGHVGEFTCASCHPAPWGRGPTDNSMKAINTGASCGVCHRGVAFPTTACGRCHEGLPSPAATPVLQDDVVLARAADSTQAGAATFPPSRFAHWVHRIRYRCSACHVDLFALQAGADTLTMAEMGAGGGCGACHDGSEAFALTDCNRCHTAPQR
jgi:c(7)-type cytochrome triheme protein